ncbi:hypothetical protein Scep_009230 [Stephania cephalantha]|uniref:K Homology domain-containing protein n=1 Tax=Stephania cephalantha TaxID=152367 RepID=A0AAP0JTI6_9MAGN
MSLPLTPSKRPYDRGSEFNGKGKWQKSGGFHSQHQPFKVASFTTTFRILCPVLKSGKIIGKGGTVISHIRQETGAKVRVEEPVSGEDERVIVISLPDKEVETANEKNKEDGADDTADKSNNSKEHDENNEDKESAPVEHAQLEKLTSSMQKALLLIFERMVEGETENDEGDRENKRPFSVVVRLLVLSNQVGCILGKGGSVIKQMAAESGAQIRILPRDKLPQCASPSDELVQITGGLEAVRRALQTVSQQLVEHPPRERDSFPASKPTGTSSHPFVPYSKPDMHPPHNYHFPAQGAPYAGGPHEHSDYHMPIPPTIPKYRENIIPSRIRPPLDFSFRLLCHNEKVGGIIGKGGSIVKVLQHETGCDIKVLDGNSDSEDRIILISGPVHPDDRISAVQDAVLRVQGRIARAAPDSNEKNTLSRIIVPSNQIGCILGKGGAIITEMRKVSGAYIRILPKDQIPKCVSENEEVVQMNGEFESVQEALLQITSKLHNHFFREMFPSTNPPALPAYPDQMPPYPYIGRRERSPPGLYSNMAPPFHKFDAGGNLPPHNRIYPHDDRPPFTHNIQRHGLPHGPGRVPSSAPWESQAVADVGGPLGGSDYSGGGPPRRLRGFGGSQPAVITSTKVEVVVPREIVPAIYGEDGESLKQIRQISGAKVNISEPRPGAAETIIIISGTPEETHAAQSLLQAFVMSETGSP